MQKSSDSPGCCSNDRCTVTVIEGDSLDILARQSPDSIDVVVTSPPYNLDIRYGAYDDGMPREEYLAWTSRWMGAVKRVLKPDGSFFLNVGGSPKDPWIPFDVAAKARLLFHLQNRIVWVKSVAIDGRTCGHFKPINSRRFLNDTYEFIFHFTASGDVSIDRLAIGVPFTDKSNIGRWGHKRDRRCRGNVWHIPYETIQRAAPKAPPRHPAIFPVELPRMCIELHGISPGMMVLDPFGGTGTTGIACKQLGVDSILIEIDSNYVAEMRKRLK